MVTSVITFNLVLLEFVYTILIQSDCITKGEYLSPNTPERAVKACKEFVTLDTYHSFKH